MSRAFAQPSLTPSVLDRLIDDEPDVTTEPESRRSMALPDLKLAVKRDLEWLLNSRQLLVAIAPGLPHLGDSLLTYGLPDFTHAALGRFEDQRELRRIIEDAIRRFEPRLSQVAVTLLEDEAIGRDLRFRIDAVLQAEPAPEAVTFDSVVKPPRNAIEVAAS